MKFFLQMFIVSLSLILLIGNGLAYAAYTKMLLDKDTSLIPAGCKIGREVRFKAGTEVTFNESGEVVEGTLIDSFWFFPVGFSRQQISNEYKYVNPQNSALFFIGKISLNDKGEVTKGTLAGFDAFFRIDAAGDILQFKQHCDISFHNNGMVSSGTLSNDTMLRPVGKNTFVKYKSGTKITLNDQGEVSSGIIVE